jgi:hypothetical protein
MNSIFVAKNGMVASGCTELILGNCENERERESLVTHGGHLHLHKYVRTKEGDRWLYANGWYSVRRFVLRN